MKKVYIEHCLLADKQHKISKRQYAHVFHKPKDNIICVAKAFYSLPYRFKMGLILHELGHLAGATGEKQADKLATELFGIEVKREDSKYGDNLETI